MANPLKYIISRSNFLFEQDFGMPVTPEQQAPSPEKPLKFLFIDPEMELKRKKYSDGSSVADYQVFSVLPSELKEWVDTNIIPTQKNKLTSSTEKLRKENIINIVSGKKVNISEEDIPFLEKLKNSLTTDIFGKREKILEVTFTHSGEPTTDDISVTFIPFKK